jgi:hypothetical protein
MTTQSLLITKEIKRIHDGQVNIQHFQVIHENRSGGRNASGIYSD